MKKAKIAISLDNALLRLVDSKVDGSIMRSRSQAIEYFLKKGLKEQSEELKFWIRKSHQPFRE